ALLARRQRLPTLFIMPPAFEFVICRLRRINCWGWEAWMHELQAIVDAYQQARQRGERAALATVVNVIGSAYRRPGAKMLITETGSTCGSISGGCLEHDVVE